MADDPSLWRSVFGDQALILAMFGALGGSVRSMALKTTWREGLRVTLIGAGTAFGAGVLAPSILKPYFGDLDAGPAALGTLTASAFLLGLIAVTLVERVLDQSRDKGEGDG